MVLPDTYERQMLWWKSHQEAAGMKAEKRERELTKGLTFKPQLATSPRQTRVKHMPQSPRGKKQASLHINRLEAARSRKTKDNSRHFWSPPDSGRSTPHNVPHSRLDLTSPPSSAPTSKSPVRRTYSKEMRSLSPTGKSREQQAGGGYASKSAASQQPPSSPGALTLPDRLVRSPRGDYDSKKRPKPAWNPAGPSAVPGASARRRSQSARGRKAGGDPMSPTARRGAEESGGHRQQRGGRVGGRGTQPLHAAIASTLGGEDLEDDDEEELKFYEQLQREKREWQKERTQLLTVIELQQRELGKRANSVQERAAEIAREFAKSVLNFEERLVALETGVHADVKEVKHMMSKVLAATAAGETDTDSSSLAHGGSTPANNSNNAGGTSNTVTQPVATTPVSGGMSSYGYAPRKGF